MPVRIGIIVLYSKQCYAQIVQVDGQAVFPDTGETAGRHSKRNAQLYSATDFIKYENMDNMKINVAVARVWWNTIKCLVLLLLIQQLISSFYVQDRIW